jgi:SpoVK/Ycf46/Vps4 family AAA+-type ATPase
MQNMPILKALIRAALAGDGREVVEHQVTRLISALRKADDPHAEVLQKVLLSAALPGRAAPSRLTRSSVSDLERMTQGVPVPVDPDSAAPLATVVFPVDNLTVQPVFAPQVSAVVESMTQEWEHQAELLAAGLRPSLTALAYGPPGTGKTTLALWFAQQLELPAVVARLDGLISSLLGTTARNLGALFAFANRYNCVLILDEFDAIAKVRDDPNEVGEIKRVVNALLQNLDSRATTGITIGLTNHESLLDPAVWRRFEVQIPVPLPGFAERASIVAASVGVASEVASEAKLIAWLTDGMSGAEVATVCDKWKKRRIIDALSITNAAEVVVQAVMSTAARFGTPSVSNLDNRDALIVALAQTNEVHFGVAELAGLFGVSPKTVSRRISEVEGGLIHD